MPNTIKSSDASVETAPGVDGEGEEENVVGTSEDFWTVGNAVKWMLLWARLSGKEIEEGGEDEKVLRELLGDVGGKGGKGVWEGMEGRNVWETVMGRREDGLVIG